MSPGLTRVQIAFLGGLILLVAAIGALEGWGKDQSDPCPIGKADANGVYEVPAGGCIRIQDAVPLEPETGTAPVSNLT